MHRYILSRDNPLITKLLPDPHKRHGERRPRLHSTFEAGLMQPRWRRDFAKTKSRRAGVELMLISSVVDGGAREITCGYSFGVSGHAHWFAAT